MVYEVYLRHGEVVLPGVVRAEIPGIAVEASGRAYSLERAIIAARNRWRAEGRPLPRSSYTTDDFPMRERLDRLERAMALLGEECPPQHAGRAIRSSPLYAEWADLKARFAAIIDPDKPFDSESPGDWERVFQRFRRWRAKLPRIPTTRRDNAELFGYERDGSWSEEAYFCDRFDLLASEWEQKQRALSVPRRCAACAEIRPDWMTTLKCVDGSPGKEPPGWLEKKWDNEQQRYVVFRPDDLLDRYHGKWLCTRCYSPLSDDERRLNILKFSKENLMHLPSLDDEGLPQVFRDYWSRDASKSKQAMAGLTSSIATFPGDGEGQCFVSDLPAEQVVTNLAAVGIPAEVVKH